MNFWDELNDWVKTLFIGDKPIIDNTLCLTGHITPKLKVAITKNINEIINYESNKLKNYKFGKTGFPPTRTDQVDYRAASYSNMYLLYESTSIDNVEELEKYYCSKYKVQKRNDNIDDKSRGKMKSIDKKYYLYFVI